MQKPQSEHLKLHGSFKGLAQPLVLFAGMRWTPGYIPHLSPDQALLSGDLHTAVQQRPVCAWPSCCINKSRE